MLRGELKRKEFATLNYFSELSRELAEHLLDNGLEIWKDDNRYVVVKEYKNNYDFLNSAEKDQLKILALLEEIPTKYKNNLYFFLVINKLTSKNDKGVLELENDKVTLEINRLEKDAFICRKYVIKTTEDLARVPFLTENNINRKTYFNYEEMFKNELLKIEDIDLNVVRAAETYFSNKEYPNLIKVLRGRDKNENK